jgi:lipopolysaccharide export system protein LptA
VQAQGKCEAMGQEKSAQSKIYAALKYTFRPDSFITRHTRNTMPQTRLFLTRPIFLLGSILLAVASLISAPAHAEKADRNKPMNAEADSLRYDDVRQTSVFTGNVVITKGTLVIRGDRVEVRQDAEGFQFATATGSRDKRAFYRQKRDVADEWIEGEALTLIYDGKQDTITFSKNAVMRRLRGTAVADETQGDTITYNNTSDVFNVLGAPAAAPGAPAGRVRAVISPRATTSAPAPEAAPGGTLRPSPTLSGESK